MMIQNLFATAPFLFHANLYVSDKTIPHVY